MFGIFYVIVFMEVEVQCVFLDVEKLVDGVVIDDVDVFLFGGCNVYKNIFDDCKYVEMYYMKVDSNSFQCILIDFIVFIVVDFYFFFGFLFFSVVC